MRPQNPSVLMPSHQAIVDLANLGAHIVLCRYDHKTGRKPPMNRNWQKIDPTEDQIKQHRAEIPDALFGIIPCSIKYAVADIDHGDPQPIIRDWEPRLVLPSHKPKRYHLWWHATSKHRPGPFEMPAYKIRGDIRSAGAYIVIWGNKYALNLLHTARQPLYSNLDFPADLFDYARTTNRSTSTPHYHQRSASENGKRSGVVRKQTSDANAEEAALMENDGYTVPQISDVLDVSPRTVYRYLRIQP